MDYRWWCLLLVALVSTLGLTYATPLKDLASNGALAASDPFDDVAQRVDEEIRKTMSKIPEEKCRILDDGSIRCGALVPSGPFNDVTQHVDKEVRKETSKTRVEKCTVLDGSVKCTYEETTSTFSLTWTKGAIAGLVVGLLVLVACMIACCIFCCRGDYGRRSAQPTVAFQTPHHVSMGQAPPIPPGAYPKQQYYY